MAVFIPLPKKGNLKECSNYRTISLIVHASKVLLKIIKGRIKLHYDREMAEEQAGFVEGKGTIENNFSQYQDYYTEVSRLKYIYHCVFH